MTVIRASFENAFYGLEGLRFKGGIIDPPWEWKSWSPKGYDKSPQKHYECKNLSWIKSLPVYDLFDDNSMIMLWATNPMLDKAFEVINAWGFDYCTAGTWIKMSRAWYADIKYAKQAFGGGYRLRFTNEPYLLATKGNPPIRARDIRGGFMGAVREPSRKPDFQYYIIENLVYDFKPADSRYVELFSRSDRKNWICWGDKAGMFNNQKR